MLFHWFPYYIQKELDYVILENIIKIKSKI